MSRDRNLSSGADEEAPPPYTPTDIYSNSASNRSASGDASQTSTIEGDIIYTPPASPPAPALAPLPSDYYALPPARTGNSPPPIVVVHELSVNFDTLPEELPYSTHSLGDSGVTEQDWATFLNYLLPDHTARRNEALVDRKLREEDASSTGSGGKSRAEEQLSGIVGGGEERMDEATWRSHATRIVKEWNETYFEPKGVSVQLQAPENQFRPQERTMPGAWNSSDADQQTSGSQGYENHQQQQQQQGRSGWLKRFDRVKMTDNTLRIGDNFVADVNGLKIGGLVMDGRGIRMDGGQPQPPPGLGGPVAGGFPRGMPGRWPSGGAPPGCHHPGAGDPRGRGFGPSFGPAMGPEKQRHRSHSVSSVSSISSVSSVSSASVSSLESLPNYDDLNDNQLPLYAARLDAWVHSPDTIRSRQDINDLKAELKLARAASLDPSVDRKALKKHVKTLRQEWKGVRREQKRMMKERKREKRSRRRGEKRERRERKREVKRSAREIKRELKGARREQKEARRESRGCERGQWPTHCSGQMPEGMGMFGRGRGRGGPAPFGGLFGGRGVFGPQGSFDSRNYSPFGSHPFQPPPPPLPFPQGVLGPRGGSFPQEPFGNVGGTRDAPPGAWPDDKAYPWQYPDEKKADPAVEQRVAGNGQEAGVVDAPHLEDKVRELEGELERKIMALDEMEQGEKRRGEREKEVEALMEKLDGLRLEMDERYARELADRE